MGEHNELWEAERRGSRRGFKEGGFARRLAEIAKLGVQGMAQRITELERGERRMSARIQELEAENARLRRIEEAAREHANATECQSAGCANSGGDPSRTKPRRRKRMPDPEPSKRFTRYEIIERYCKLESAVRSAFDLSLPRDCFCCGSGTEDYQNTGEALEVIERIVRRAVNDHANTLEWLKSEESPDDQPAG